MPSVCYLEHSAVTDSSLRMHINAEFFQQGDTEIALGSALGMLEHFLRVLRRFGGDAVRLLPALLL